MSHQHHGGPGPATTVVDAPRVALVGSPNAGKTTLFNSLTGLRAKTGNYPGVTVARYEGVLDTPVGPFVVEDLPGTYSLDPISPDEEVVAHALEQAHELAGLLVVVDATNLRRGLGVGNGGPVDAEIIALLGDGDAQQTLPAQQGIGA